MDYTCETPPAKKQKLQGAGGEGDDPDETPRISDRGRRGPLPTGSPSISFSAPSDRSERSRTSSRSSPLKQLAALEVSSDAVEPRALSLSDPNLPPALSDLLEDLEKCNNGTHVIPFGLQPEINANKNENRSFRTVEERMYIPAHYPQCGPVLPLRIAVHLAKEATECFLEEHSEAGWNSMVHYPVLFWAILGEERWSQPLGVANCTDAKIIREYLPTSAQAKMIDFCIYAEIKTDDSSLKACSFLRRMLPDNVINHTSYHPLRQRPIVISIETKKPHGASAATAELQISTWLAAQWKFLEELVKQSEGSFDGLPFLPGIIVEGHNWLFVATTREGRKTVLWREQMFGSTSSFLGVYKTIWGLRRLAEWAREVYWPWFQENALGITKK